MSDSYSDHYVSELPYQDPSVEQEFMFGKKRSRRLLLGCGIGCLGLLFLLLLGSIFVYFYCIKGKPLIVSPETTIITEPLKSDGKTVDYYQAIQKMTEPDVPANENGFRSVLLGYGRAVFGTRDQETAAWQYPEMCKKLDIDPNTLPAFVLDHWTPTNPQQWHAVVDPGLNMVQTAAAKKNYFVPIVRQSEKDLMLVSQPIAIYGFHTKLSAALRQRAKLRFEANDPASAWKDTLTTIRLFRFVTVNQALLESFADDKKEKEGKKESPLLTPINDVIASFEYWQPEQLDRAISDLESLPNWTDHKTMLKTMQFCILDIISATDDLYGLLDRLGAKIPADAAQALHLIGFDWNEVAKELNSQIARYEQILEKNAGEDPNKQIEILQELRQQGDNPMNKEGLEKEIKRLLTDPMDSGLTPVDAVLTSGRSRLTGQIAARIATLLVGEIYRLQLAEETRCQCLRIALAVERYYRQKEQYPDSLDELGLQPMKPDMMLRYEKTESGYRIQNDIFRLRME